MKTFNFSITCEVALDVDQIWPDGDAPQDPTVKDVLKVIDRCGGKAKIIDDWSLIDDLTLEVSDGTETEHDVP
jgi:hypothetical protein